MGNIMDIVNIPLAMILKLCYIIVQNYGFAIILFAILTKILLLPFGIKTEKNRLRMAQIQPKVNALQAKFGGNTKDPKYSEELQKIYQQEGYNPISGCLPTLIQLPVMLGLWNAIRRPLTYICSLSQAALYNIVITLRDAGVDAITEGLTKANAVDQKAIVSWMNTYEISVAKSITENHELVKGLLPEGFINIDMEFLGLDLGANPVMGLHPTVIIPIISGITSFLVGFVAQKINKATTPAGDNAAKSNANFILYFMPLFSIWIGFNLSNGVAVYWIAGNILSLIQTILLPKIMKPPVAQIVDKPKKINYNQIKKLQAQQEDKKDNDETNDQK